MPFLLSLTKPYSGCRTNIQVLTFSSILLSLEPIVFVPLSFMRSTEDKNGAKKNIIQTLYKHTCALRLQDNNKLTATLRTTKGSNYSKTWCGVEECESRKCNE